MVGLELMAAAIHESAHAVVGRVLGLDCGAASASGEDGFAIVQPRYRDGACGNLARAITLVSMSGAEAERAILRRPRSSILDAGDRARQARWANVFDWEVEEPRLRREARALVRQHRDAIEAVSEQLAARGTLSGPEIDAIMVARPWEGREIGP
jgi:hypothetical protein